MVTTTTTTTTTTKTVSKCAVPRPGLLEPFRLMESAVAETRASDWRGADLLMMMMMMPPPQDMDGQRNSAPLLQVAGARSVCAPTVRSAFSNRALRNCTFVGVLYFSDHALCNCTLLVYTLPSLITHFVIAHF